MHYGPYAFSKEGKPTIIMRTTGAEMGQRRGFSKVTKALTSKLGPCLNNCSICCNIPPLLILIMYYMTDVP